MSKQHVEGLLTRLHEKFADSDTSPEQEALLEQLQSQLASWEGPAPADGSVVTTAELLLAELNERHPNLSAALREFINNLGGSGI